MKRVSIFLTLILCCTALFAQAPLRSGRPLMSSDPEGFAPLGILQSIAALPAGAAYLRPSDPNPSIFLLARAGTPEARGLYCATMAGTRKPGGELVFNAPVKTKPYWGKPSKMPQYGCLFEYKGGVLSFWEEGKNTLTLASYNPDTQELARVASVSVEGLAGVHSLSASELPDGYIELIALVGDGSKYREERAKDESWYDGANIFKGALSRSGVRRVVLKDPLSGGTFKPVSPASFLIAANSAIGLKDDFLGADGYLVGNRFGTLAWQEASSIDAPRGWVRDETGRQVTYPAHGGVMTLLQFRSGEKMVVMGAEGPLVSCRFEGMGTDGPQLAQPRTVLMRKGSLYTGSLGVPDVADWDGDGVLDIICGNSEGRILFFKNEGTDVAPVFSSFAQQLLCEGEPLCIRPGYIGVQGPFEAVWGYMCPAVFDWDGDGLPDIVFSDSRGKLEVLLNTGDASRINLRRPFALKQDGLEIKGLWRVKPAVATVGGRVCEVNMDGDGSFHRWWKIDNETLVDDGPLLLRDGHPITAHAASVGRDGNLGRVKINLCDWDGDGDLDLILGTPQTSCLPRPERGIPNGFVLKQSMLQVFYLENVGTDAKPRFAEPLGFKVGGKDLNLGVHANAPAPCFLGPVSNGPNLLVGCESGRLFWIDRKDLSTFTVKDRYEKK